MRTGSVVGCVGVGRVVGRMLAVLVFATRMAATAAPAYQVVDLNQVIPDSVDPVTISGIPVAIGATVFFTADDHIHGAELWKTDGTESGTVLVKDICPGYCAGRPLSLTALAGILYFTADDGAHGRELWRSDGTTAGTFMVKDINPGLASSTSTVVAWKGRLFFAADDGRHGSELWVSDGTAAGTVMLADIHPGPAGSYPSPQALGANLLLFAADDGVHGYEPWLTDGTAAGTHLVADLNPGPGPSGLGTDLSFAPAVQLTGDTFLFQVGFQLWRTDGTAAGTALLHDFLPAGSGYGYPPSGMMAWNGNVYFSAGVPDAALWRSDGTAAGTLQLAPVEPRKITVVGGRLLFAGYDGTNGTRLWSSDGTAVGTTVIKDIAPGLFANGFQAIPGGVLFFAFGGGSAGQPWRSDGTAAGTMPVADIYPGQSSYPGLQTGSAAVGGTAFFFAFDAEDPSAPSLWKSDGTAGGTTRVKRLTTVDSSIDVSDGRLAKPTFAPLGDGRALFSAGNSLIQLLWVTDGTAGGTSHLAAPAWSEVTPALGSVFFTNSLGVWRTDGTASGTAQLGGSGSDHELTPTPHALFFSDGSIPQLWKSDGTPAGTAQVTTFSPNYGVYELTAFGNDVLFIAYDQGWQPWISDGTVAGTREIAKVTSCCAYPTTYPARFAVVGDVAFFAADDGIHGVELWKTDGTAAGTGLVTDLNAGGASALPAPDDPTVQGGAVAVAFQGQLFFAADDGRLGEELWRSDGTPGGTQLVKDINPGTGGSQPRQLTVAGNRLYFVADDGVHGREPWVSDGTAFGTLMLKDITPGPESSVPQQLTAVDHTVLFSAADPAFGREPWVSDGTPGGTRRLQDIAPGLLPASPMAFTAAGPLVFFAANDGTTGFEPWAVPRAALDLGSSFYTVKPCRLVDTRNGTPLVTGTPRAFAVTGGCGIPPTAKAIAVNLTIVGATTSGDLQVYATGSSPPGTNSLSFVPGRARANNAIVQLAAGGFSALLDAAGGVNASADFIADVSGWFE